MSGAATGTRLLIVGPPGAGKGTQAAFVAESYGIPAISTGDIFRANIREGTPLGLEVQKVVSAGDYVPDSLTNRIVSDRLGEDDAQGGFLLDGYPRTLDQVAYLDDFLKAQGKKLQGVIQLVADTDALIARLLKRATEQGRADDSEEAIRHRQQIYLAETAPLIDVYRGRGLLLEVDGMGTVAEVTARISGALAQAGLGSAAN